MRWSEYFIPTLKTTPKEVKFSPFKLLIKAGMLRLTKQGDYFYLPLGLRLINKIDAFNRLVFQKYGGLEIAFAGVYASVAQHHNGEITYQQCILHLFRNLISTYRQLPLLFYHFIAQAEGEGGKNRGFSGGFASRFLEAFWLESEAKADYPGEAELEKIIKDILKKLGIKTYEVNLFKNIGLEAKWILSLQENGDLEIAKCPSCDVIVHPAQIDSSSSTGLKKSLKELQLIETPAMVTVEDVCHFLKKKPQDILKTIILTADGTSIAVLLRGDLQLSLKKLRLFLRRRNIQLANEDLIREITSAPMGFSGPISLKKDIQLVGDFSILTMVNCIAGANREDYHYINANLNRDFKVEKFADLNQPETEETCPSCNNKITISRFNQIAELSYPFGWGDKPIIIDGEKGKAKLSISYLKLDIPSLLVSLIESYKDEKGISWPKVIAPFDVIILLLSPHIDEIRKIGEEVYADLIDAGIESLLDDRSIGVGAKFSDAELLGIPLQIVFGRKYLQSGKIEIKMRQSNQSIETAPQNLVPELRELLENY